MSKKKETFEERYNFKCAKCGHEQSAAPSWGMQSGHNSGHGSCMKCKTFLHLEITPDIFGKEMKSEIWDEFLKRKGVKNE